MTVTEPTTVPLRDRWRRACGVTLLCLLTPQPVIADQVTQIPFSDSPAGAVGLGAGLRYGDSPYRGVDNVSSMHNDNSSDLVPLYLYEGKTLFFHSTRAGAHLLQDAVTLDALVQYRFDRLEPESSDYFRTVDQRDQTLEAGLSVSKALGPHRVSVTALQDVQSRHNGHAVDATYRYQWQEGRLTLSPWASIIYHSGDLLDYYYGVDAHEARLDLPIYQASAATFARLGLNGSYRLFDNWQLFANISWEPLPDQVTDSPLVDKDELFSAYVGVHYTFGNVFETDTRTRRREPSGAGNWSWRVHGGYQAEATFHQLYRGDIEKSKDTDTHLAGMTFGRLLSDGDIVDFWGKFSINRRFEDDLQDDFWDYSLYVMAMGSGYAPWSQRELFRWGFGFGFDYAEQIPMVEQIKQAKKEGEDAHFLNYLEVQVDFPFRNFTAARPLQNCYFGVSLIHRSGIFATADILSNVAGGSDILAGHIECKR